MVFLTPRLVSLSIVGLACIVYVLSLTPAMGHALDDAYHLIVAKALAEGQGLRLISDPQAPPATQFPPGLSLSLVPLLWLFPKVPANIIPLKMVSVVFTVLYLLLLYPLFSKRLPASWALAIVALTAFNPETIRFSGQIMAEMGYAFFSFLTLYWFDRYLARPGSSNYQLTIASTQPPILLRKCKFFFETCLNHRNLTVVLLAMTGAYLMRSVGLALVGAVGLALWLRKGFNVALVVVVGFLLLVSSWLLQSSLIGTPEYQSQFFTKDLENPELGRADWIFVGQRALQNLQVYSLQTIPVHLLPTLGSQRLIAGLRTYGLEDGLMGLGLVLTLIVVWGFITRIYQKMELSELYLFLYFGTVLIWHSRLHWKYMAPITPLLWYYFILGLTCMVRAIKQWMGKPKLDYHLRWIGVAIFVLFLGGNLLRTSDYVQTGWVFNANSENPYAGIFSWIRTHTPPESKLMVINHLMFYLYTDRKAVAPLYSWNPEVAMTYVKEKHPDYLIVHPAQVTNTGPMLDRAYLKPLVARFPEHFEALYSDPAVDTTIYAVR